MDPIKSTKTTLKRLIKRCVFKCRLKESVLVICKVYYPTRHSLGHFGDGVLQVWWPNQQCQSTEV